MEGFYPVKHWMAGYNLMLWDVKKYRYGGERGIRTLGTVARTRDFQSRTFGHSVTSPLQICPEKSKTFPAHKFYLR